jgi:hypothetical protein
MKHQPAKTIFLTIGFASLLFFFKVAAQNGWRKTKAILTL